MLALASICFSQDLPSSIRGYKVHRVKVQVRTAGDTNSTNRAATVKVGDPQVVDVGLDGITLEATAVISGLDQDGQVDFLMFKDIVVNGIPLAISDYEHPFGLKHTAAVALPIAVRGTVTAVNVAAAAYREATASRDEWQVSGTVFVFGRFKKMGLTFKRVIPVPITLVIPNPLRNLSGATSR